MIGMGGSSRTFSFRGASASLVVDCDGGVGLGRSLLWISVVGLISVLEGCAMVIVVLVRHEAAEAEVFGPEW